MAITNNDGGSSVQLVDGDGNFNVNGLEKFIREAELIKYGKSYRMISIIGLQSSGKSTLLNCLFRTNFREMDALRGRSKTTKGIWLAKYVGTEPCTLIMDLEGTDGAERGEDNAFEKRSTLFALAVSNIVLINIWCHDIGCEHAANRPLLRTVFEIMMRSFGLHRTTLMFVIRDKSSTPLDILGAQLRQDIEKIWNSVPKPPCYRTTQISQFFEVEVEALSRYDDLQFNQQVVSLRKRLFFLAKDCEAAVPSSGFSASAGEIWKSIRVNRDLDLPSLAVMIATIRCEVIATDIFVSFTEKQEWLQLAEAVRYGFISSFGKKLKVLLQAFLNKYYEETKYFHDGVRKAKGDSLEEKLLLHVQPVVQSSVSFLHGETLNEFKKAVDKAANERKVFLDTANHFAQLFMGRFDEGCKDLLIGHATWDTRQIRDRLLADMKKHINSVHDKKLSILREGYKEKLRKALEGLVSEALDIANETTWPKIKELHLGETQSTISMLRLELSNFSLDRKMRNEIIAEVVPYSKDLIESMARKKVKGVSLLMNQRFIKLFQKLTCDLKKEKDIRDAAKRARSGALKILSVMAAVRLTDYEDDIESTLSLCFLDGGEITSLLELSNWNNIPCSETLISPSKCCSLWRKFLEESEKTINTVISTQKQNPSAAPVIAAASAVGATILVVGVAATVIAIYAGAGPAVAVAVAGGPVISAVARVVQASLRYLASCEKK